MITYNILLIEIGLVVITTVHHISADSRIAVCEEMIKEVGIFDSGKDKGLENARHAFKNINFANIQAAVDKLPDNYVSASTRQKQRQLTIDYSLCLLKGLNYLERNFLVPDAWCRDIVTKHRETGLIKREDSFGDQVEVCSESIVGHLVTHNEILYGKFGILKGMHENWSYKRLDDIIKVGQSFNVMHYTLGYFNHVVLYVNDMGQKPELFKSIKQFCAEEGYKKITIED